MPDLTSAQLLEIRATLPDDQEPYLFSNEQLNAIYNGSGKESILRTLGWASFALGGGAALVGTVRNDEISTSGAVDAEAWRKRAQWFFDQADSEDGADEYFDLIEPGPVFCRPPELAPWDYGWPRW